MKDSVLLHRSVLILFAIVTSALLAVGAHSQGVVHTTTATNTVASRSIIDIPLLNGNPTAMIIATPIGTAATNNPHPIGAWYYNDRWSIFNVDHANMPVGLQFKLEYFIRSDSNHFLHIVTNGRGPAYIDNPSLNNNATVQVRIFQNHAPDFRASRLNRYEAAAEYDTAAGKWLIKNLNGLAVLPDTAYNVVVGSQTITTPKLAVHIPELTVKATVSDQPAQPAATTQPTSPATESCSDEMARQTIGKWARQKADDLAMADRTFPKTGYKPILAKAQEVIELFKIANPEFKGIVAHAYRGIRGQSIIPNGPVPFRVDVWYGSFICVGNDTYKVDMRGKVIVHGNYGYTVVSFNSLDDVLRSPRDDAPLLTADGAEIREYTKDLGEFKGYPYIQTSHRDSYHEAIIIASNDRLPYKPVTREQYLRARVQDYQKNGFTGDAVAGFNRVLENMSPSELNAPAIVRDVSAMPGGSRLFATEAEGGRHLVTVDKNYFNPKLPRDKIQLITVHWHSSPNDPNDRPKIEMLKAFKENFDFIALWEMLDNQK